ncbi:MAG: cobalamin-independent methionine synthase II family protein [Burkholderiales bacterium]
MRLSTDRIRTTHVGSLPRVASVVEQLYKKDKGEAFDPGEFASTMRLAVAEVVKRQVAIGIDQVSDGEVSKVGYSTYIQDRLNGFGGHTDRKPSLDLKDYPDFRKRMALLTGPQEFRRASCIGPISIKDRAPLELDLKHFSEALKSANASEGFMTAASPGVVSAFQPNTYYPTHEAYVEAIGTVMKEEYEAIVAAGFVLQVDCPDLAMARHTGFQDLTEGQFLKRAAHQVEVLNAALANIPATSVRMHVCWGNYEGPHDHDIDLVKVLPIILKGKPHAISFEAANPRHEHEWVVWKAARLPDDKVLIPGVLDTSTNFVEHPELVAQRLCTFADIVGRERVLAGTDCGFGTFAGYGKLDPEISYKKLATMVEGARIASGRLWGKQ